MAYHSQKWHDGTSSRNVSSNSNTDGFAATVSKLDNLGRDIKKLKENVHVIQVGCQICEGPNLDKECPLNEEVKQMKEVNYGEFRCPEPFNRNNGAKFRVGPPGYHTRTDSQTPSGEKRPNLVETINKYMEEATKRQVKQDEWLKTFCQNTEKIRIDHDKIIQKLESHVKTLTAEVETKEALVHETMESLKKIKINRPLLKEIRQTDNYPKYMKDLVVNKKLTEEDDEVRINLRCSSILQHHLPPTENDLESFILPCFIGRLDFNNALADLGASVSIIPFSMFKRLGIGKLEPIDMLIEMTDDTKCISKGIVKNLLIKIDKFILLVDFVILDMIEDFRRPVILGRHLLAIPHVKVDIFRKTFSLEVGNEKVIFKMRSDFSNNIHESVRMIKTKMKTKEDELMKIDSDLFTYNTDACKINHLLSIHPYVFTYDIEVQESYEKIVYRCNLITQEANEGFSLGRNEIKCYWESENDGKRIYVEWENLSLNDWLRIKFGEVSKTARDKILRDHWRKRFGNEYDDSEDFKDPDGCGESKENNILGTIINKLRDEL
nr:hypothetical protein [Tanacetum cinerariifolium]